VSYVKGQNRYLSGTVTVYSLASLWSFINVSYIRDLEALQLNIVPIFLTIASFVAIETHGLDFQLAGMTFFLMADSYFALRYNDGSDKIEFTILEKFCREGWTQHMLMKKKMSITFRIMAATIIFVQLFLATMGTIYSESMSKVILGFYLLRIGQYLLRTVYLVDMVQSNMMCVALSLYALLNISSGGLYFKATAMVLVLDAILGSLYFVITNEQEVKEFVGIDNLWFVTEKENIWKMTKGHSVFDASKDDDF